jgi:predicted heme/steroid binding protein/uncharacterized membrane protein
VRLVQSFSAGELARFDGKDGKPSYVAVNGIVYDVSSSKRWGGGGHMRRHQAGADLTADLNAAPHGIDKLEQFPKVGTLAKEAPQEGRVGVKACIEALLDRFPFFRRHPHPAIVHFPVAFLLGASLFQIAALVLGSSRMEWTAFSCLALGMITVPVAIATGYFTWWINYDMVDSPIIRTKRRMALGILFIGAAAVVLRSFFLTIPLAVGDLATLAYTGTLLCVSALAGLVGFLGGKLVFPFE